MKKILISLSLFACASLASAGTLLSWDIPTAVQNVTSIVATVVDDSIATTSLTRSGIGRGFEGNFLVNYGWRLELPAATGYDSSKYISFTISPEPGYQVTVDQIFFRFGSNTAASGTFEIRSDLDSFGSTISSALLPAFQASGGTRTFAITGVDNVSSPVEFRLYSYLTTTVGGQRNITFGANPNELDDFVVSGTAIPEPSTYALLAGMLTLTVVVLRRRRA
jgi:hypothetical protein